MKDTVEYTIERTATEWPWRYWVRVNGRAVSLTFTRWGARRLVARMKRAKDDVEYL